jgi:hypothetical protein
MHETIFYSNLLKDKKMHFEELWVAAEKKFEDGIKQDFTNSIVDQVVVQMSLYKVIDSKTELSADDKKQAKNHIMGRILLALANLSIKDDIDVFAVLQGALQDKQIT